MDVSFLDSEVDQIDLTPTICMLKGNPIPINNVGSIIPDFFLDLPEITNTVIANAYFTNFRQVQSFFEKKH